MPELTVAPKTWNELKSALLGVRKRCAEHQGVLLPARPKTCSPRCGSNPGIHRVRISEARLDILAHAAVLVRSGGNFGDFLSGLNGRGVKVGLQAKWIRRILLTTTSVDYVGYVAYGRSLRSGAG